MYRLVPLHHFLASICTALPIRRPTSEGPFLSSRVTNGGSVHNKIWKWLGCIHPAHLDRTVLPLCPTSTLARHPTLCMSSLPRDSSPSGLDAGTGAHFAEEALHTPSDLPDDISAPTAAMQRGKTDSTAGKGRWRRGRLGGGGGLGRMSGLAQTHLLSHVAWVVPVLRDWAKMKPVLRSALAAWLCMLCMIIRPIEVALGTASFLILVGIFIQPCELPFVAIIEREFFTLLLTAIGWAYANFAIFLAHLARNSKFPAELVEQEVVYSGGYIEAGPTAICTVFLAVGVAALLYLKVKFGPSPFLFASILGCISLDIT